jgi:outer membrane protein, adhesin transport system
MKRSIRLLLSVLFLCFGSFNLIGQRPLSLEECIEIALEQNYNLRIVRNQEQITQNNYTRGNAGFLPSLDLRSSYSGNWNNTNQNLRDGTENSFRNIHNTAANAGLQAGWMLFEGFSARIRYQQLEELKTLSELNTRISIENMVAGIASEYYFYIQQKRLFSNLQYAVDLSKERVRIEQEHFLLGSGSKVRLLQAQVNLNADSSRLERQHEVLMASRIRLSEYVAADDLEAGFVPGDTLIAIDQGLVYDDLLPDLLSHNASILAAQHNIVISEADLRLIKSRQLPYLSLASGYGFTHSTSQSGSFTDQQTWGMNYGLTLGLRIYDGRNQQRLQNNARIELENRDLMLQRVKQDVMADFLTIFNSYNNNLRLLTLETQNLEVARENIDIAFERYRLGGLSGFELREVQKNLLEAEERLLSIQYQAKLAEINLLLLSGRILD